jgi:hypothetical protein
VSSHDGTLLFEFASDSAGTDVVRSLSIPYTTEDGYQLFGAPVFAQYIQYSFTNDELVTQTDFYYTTRFYTKSISGQVLDLESFVSPSMIANLGRNVIVAKTSAGTYTNVNSNQFGDLQVSLTDPVTAFGDLRTSQLTAVAQFTFPYVLNPRQWDSTLTGSAASGVSQSRMDVSTGTTTGSTATVQSFKRIKYRPGVGQVIRYTTAYMTAVANTTQYVGVIDDQDGFAFGYQGTTFGILRRTVSGDAGPAPYTPAETFVAQADWNVDPADGTQTLPAITWSNGNVFEITYQYLGYGMIRFFVEDPATGRFQVVHQIEYANTSDETSIGHPSLPFRIELDNDTTTTDLQIYIGSVGMFTEGTITRTPIVDSFQATLTNPTTESAFFTLLAKDDFGAHENHVETFLTYLTCGFTSSGNRTVIIRVLLDATIGTPSYADVDTNSSSLQVDTAGTLTAGTGTTLFSLTLSSNSSQAINLKDLNIFFVKGQTITVSAVSSGAGDVAASLNVEEDV